jgi:hypothetical protein
MKIIVRSTFSIAPLLLLAFFCQASTARVLQAIAKYDSTVQKMQTDFAAIPSNPHDISWVQLKIQHMWDVDQFSRNYLKTPFAQNFSPEETKDFQQLFGPKIPAVDLQDTADLKELLKIYPWFKISVFGKKTDSSAWLLVQHADQDPEFQKSILKILESLYQINETNPSNYAYLFDRVASSWNNPTQRTLQRYGTQGYCTGKGTWRPLPSEDEARLDERRASVGLGTEAEYIAMFKDLCQEDQTPPCP